jgi:hypothetical protein
VQREDEEVACSLAQDGEAQSPVLHSPGLEQKPEFAHDAVPIPQLNPVSPQPVSEAKTLIRFIVKIKKNDINTKIFFINISL